MPLRRAAFSVVGGLRGALALALALSLPDATPYRDEILVGAFGVVAFSVLVQGLTAGLALKALGTRRQVGGLTSIAAFATRLALSRAASGMFEPTSGRR